MARLWFILVLAALVFWVYSVVDCAVQPSTRHRGVGKTWWVLIVVLLPVVGGILWVLVGRVGRRAIASRRAPDDDPDFLRSLGSATSQQERIRRLEAELADLDVETEIPPDTSPDADPPAPRRDGDDERA